MLPPLIPALLLLAFWCDGGDGGRAECCRGRSNDNRSRSRDAAEEEAEEDVEAAYAEDTGNAS